MVGGLTSAYTLVEAVKFGTLYFTHPNERPAEPSAAPGVTRKITSEAAP